METTTLQQSATKAHTVVSRQSTEAHPKFTDEMYDTLLALMDRDCTNAAVLLMERVMRRPCYYDKILYSHIKFFEDLPRLIAKGKVLSRKQCFGYYKMMYGIVLKPHQERPHTKSRTKKQRGLDDLFGSTREPFVPQFIQ